MTASGSSVRVTGLVFVFKSASLMLKQIPTCIRKPKTNTFDKSIKFLHWLFLVVLDGFRLIQMVLSRFRSFLNRLRSFQLIPYFSKYRLKDVIVTALLDVQTRQIFWSFQKWLHGEFPIVTTSVLFKTFKSVLTETKKT